MEIQSILSLQSEILFFLGVGFILQKKFFFTAESDKFLTDFVLYVTLPCSILLSFKIPIDKSMIWALVEIFFISFGVQVFSFLIAKLMSKQYEQQKINIIKYGIMVSNGSFIGLPVIYKLMGAGGVVFASVYLIPQRVVAWTYGLSCFTKNENSDEKKSFVSLLLHPCILSVVAGFLIFIFQLHLPNFVIKPLEAIGSSTTMLSLILIGSIISRTSKTMESINLKILLYSLVRLVVIPMIPFVLFLFLNINLNILKVVVVLAGMPAGITIVILSEKYGHNVKYASSLLIVSTLLSIFTIPIWILLLNLIVKN
jgi:predicted permease